MVELDVCRPKRKRFKSSLYEGIDMKVPAATVMNATQAIVETSVTVLLNVVREVG